MIDTAAVAARLRTRLGELDAAIARLETALRAPLDADFAEKAAELEASEALPAIEDSHRAEIAAIRAALARIDAGRYGRCDICGAVIPAARLTALPTAATCITHAEH